MSLTLRRIVTGFEMAVVMVLSQAAGFAQSSLVLSSSSAPAGGMATLALTVTSPSGAGPAGVQWSLAYDPVSVAIITASVGPSAASAGKSITCAAATGSLKCILIGLNTAPIADGTLAFVSVTLTARAANTVPIHLTGTIAASPAGGVVTVAGTDGAVVVTLASTGQPVVSGIPAGVLDAGSYTPNVAPGSIFVVKGTQLSPSGVVQALAYPLQTSLNGVSVSFRPANGGGNPVDAYLLYTYNQNGTEQLGAVLPSGTPVGNYSVTVTNNGSTSAAVLVAVSARKFELFTADTTGSGMVAAQEVDPTGAYHFNRFTTGTLPASGLNSYAPAHPGDYLIVYGTGLGAISGPDNRAPGAIDMRSQVPIQVLVGGQAITPLYAGRSPAYAGLDQINLQLPADVTTGCTVSFQVSVSGQISNPTTIAIAPAGSAACISSLLSQTVLSQLDQGRRLVVGNFLLSQYAATIAGVDSGLNESALGAFASYSGFQLANALRYANPVGACQVFRLAGNANQLLFGSVGTPLDAGAVMLSGSSLPDQSFNEDAVTRTYSLELGTEIVLPIGLSVPAGFPSINTTPVIGQGTYQLTGSGGVDIGAFAATATVGSAVTSSAPLPANIVRSRELTVSWTGGNPTDLLMLTGGSGTVVGGTAGAPIYDAATFTCTTTAGDGSLTVPVTVLQQLPATPSVAGIGFLELSSWPKPLPGNGIFTAPLTAGGSLDSGVFLGTLGLFSTSVYQ